MPDAAALDEFYRTLTDLELLNLKREGGLTEEAERVLGKELARRNLGEEDLKRHVSVIERSKLREYRRPALLFASIGALSFWAPDLAVHVWAGHSFDSPHVRAITCLIPAALLVAYLISRRRARVDGFRWIGVVMIIGVWLTGGFFMMLTATVGGGGFATGGFTTILLVIGSVIPILTWIMATYDGSLGALIIVTAAALLIWAFEASGLREAISHPRN